MKSHITLALFFFTLLVSGTAFAAENAASTADKSEPKPWVRKVVFGILAHDIGPLADSQESLAPDPNWEVQFNPPEWRWWRWVGSPSPMTGAIPNFTGGTSAFYLGLAWQLSLSYEFLNNLTNDFTRRMWVSGGWGPAIHNGPLTKNTTDCRSREGSLKTTGECGFGTRVLPMLQIEIGATFWKNHALSLYGDHMSGGAVFGGAQNEGLDHVGLRYHFFFNKNGTP